METDQQSVRFLIRRFNFEIFRTQGKNLRSFLHKSNSFDFTGCIIKKRNIDDYKRGDKRVQKLFRAFLSSH